MGEHKPSRDKVANFKQDLEEVYERHGMSIGQDEFSGEMLIQGVSERNVEALRVADCIFKGGALFLEKGADGMSYQGWGFAWEEFFSEKSFGLSQEDRQSIICLAFAAFRDQISPAGNGFDPVVGRDVIEFLDGLFLAYAAARGFRRAP